MRKLRIATVKCTESMLLSKVCGHLLVIIKYGCVFCAEYTLWEMQNRESDTADPSTNEVTVSAVHPRHDESLRSHVLVSFCL